MKTKLKVQSLTWGVVAALPLTLGLSSQASAVPYAYASNVDSGFTIGVAPGSGGSYTPNMQTSVFQTSNSVSSSYLVTPPGTNAAGANGSDAAQVTAGVGPFPGQNFFGQALQASSGLRADSVDSGFNGSGGNVAEGRLVGAPSFGSGSSVGSLTSTNSSAITVTVTAGTSLRISFSDAVGLVASTAPLNAESATATIASSVRITTAAGATVFSFAPTGGGAGSTSAVTGGTVVSDPFSLNQSLASTAGTPSVNSFLNSGFFAADTVLLAAGTYNVLISQSASENLTAGIPVPVPEPVSMALLGTGLIGLGMFGRKKRA